MLLDGFVLKILSVSEAISPAEPTRPWVARISAKLHSSRRLCYQCKLDTRLIGRACNSFVFSVVFAVIFFLNLFLLAAGSSGAVPFGMLHRLGIVSIPLNTGRTRYHGSHRSPLVRYLRSTIRRWFLLWQ